MSTGFGESGSQNEWGSTFQRRQIRLRGFTVKRRIALERCTARMPRIVPENA